MSQILIRLDKGGATEEDLDTLLDLADNIHSKTICFFGASAAMPVQSFLQKFKPEFLAKIEAARAKVAPQVVATTNSEAAGASAGAK
jgi:NADH-quinone oxidoreductase subunit F